MKRTLHFPNKASKMVNDQIKNHSNVDTHKLSPPARSKNIFTDIKYFFFEKPPIETIIKFASDKERKEYCELILQRINIGVESYKMLNIHRIGVETPASYLFEELLKWNGDSTCWPNHIAKVNLHDNKLEKIQIFLFGRTNESFRIKRPLFGLRLLHLFDLNAIKIQRVPVPSDSDNARYLLYESKGGYPIGVFCMYVRSSIPERGEKEMSQLFFMVGFNFFGNKTLSRVKIIRKIWAAIHNRATSNVAYRFKLLSEWRFDKFSNGN